MCQKLKLILIKFNLSYKFKLLKLINYLIFHFLKQKSIYLNK